MSGETDSYLLVECSDQAMLERLEKAVSKISDWRSRLPRDEADGLVEKLTLFQEDMRSRPNGAIMIDLMYIDIMRKLGV